MHSRVTTSTIRLVREGTGSFYSGPAYKGELWVTYPEWHTAVQNYFPNFNFTRMLPEAVPHVFP